MSCVALLLLRGAVGGAQIASPASGPAPPTPEPAVVAAPPITHLAAPLPRPDTHQAEENARSTGRLQPTGVTPNYLGFLGPFRRPHVPELFPGSPARLNALVRDDKL